MQKMRTFTENNINAKKDKMLILWRTDTIMTSVKTMAYTIAILAMVFGFLWGWSINDAFGEEFQDVVTFPVPDNIIDQFKKGQLITMTDKVLEFQVTYKFILGTDGEEWHDRLLIESGLLTPDCEFGYDPETLSCLDEIVIDIVQQEIDEYNASLPNMARYQADLARLQDKPPINQHQEDYLMLLEELATCQRGTGSAKGIQTEDRFPVSTSKIDPNIIDNQAYGGNLGNLAKAVEACIYQKTILEPITLGPEAFNKGVFADTIQPYHAEFAHYNEEFWANIPTQSDNIIDEHDIAVTQKSAWELMCASELVSENFKKDQGCPAKEYETTAPRSDGHIELNSYVMDYLTRYKQLGDQEQLDKILAEQKRQNEIAEELIRSQVK